MGSQLFCHSQQGCREPLSAISLRRPPGQDQVEQGCKGARTSTGPLSLFSVCLARCFPSGLIREGGERRKEQSRGRRDMGAGWGEEGLSRMWSQGLGRQAAWAGAHSVPFSSCETMGSSPSFRELEILSDLFLLISAISGQMCTYQGMKSQVMIFFSYKIMIVKSWGRKHDEQSIQHYLWNMRFFTF